MASHFQWYPASGQDVTPWNAQYTFPEQSNKSIRVATRVPPRNGPSFVQGNTIRLEFPAQGYVNTAETTITFDVKLDVVNYTDGSDWAVYFQNNIQSIFSKARLMYGSTPLEDIQNVGFLVRQLTEWTSSNDAIDDQASVAQGIGGYKDYGIQSEGQFVNTRKYTHSIQKLTTLPATGFGTPFTGVKVFPSGSSTSGTFYATRRYQIQIPFGIFQQGKLLPVKYMASQLAIELTLASNVEAIMVHACTNYLPADGQIVSNFAGLPRFTVSNVSLMIESFEFDASYDAMFLEGLQSGGVPIQFSTWNNYSFQQGSTLSNYILIQEKSRSVKAIFAMLRLQNKAYTDDSGATFGGLVSSMLLSYQYRIGARYFPASPVICSGEGGTSATGQTPLNSSNGACEAYIELQKCLGTLGDSNLSTAVNSNRWGTPVTANLTGNSFGIPTPPSTGMSSDGQFGFNVSVTDAGFYNASCTPSGTTSTTFSSIFCMPIWLETTNGRDISGLNAEEQSDISLMLKFSGNGNSTVPMVIEIFTYNDAMVILRENNVMELIK